SRITLLPNTPGVDNFDHVCWTMNANGIVTDTNCVIQPNPAAGAPEVLSAVSDRPGYRFAYRNFGDHESFSLTHTVQAGFQQFGEPTEIAWWEVRNLNTNPSIFQDHTQFDRTANDPGANINRWLASIAMDKTGDMLLGYSISAGTDANNSTIQINPSLAL